MNRESCAPWRALLAFGLLAVTACAQMPAGPTRAEAGDGRTGKSDAPPAAAIAQGRSRNPEIVDVSGRVAGLVKAAEDGDAVKVKRLLDAGVDPNAMNADHRTALSGAAESGKEEVARLMLDHGAKPDGQLPDTGWAPLHIAAFLGHVEVARVLLDRGANINIKNKYGETALLQAAFRGQDEVVKLLLAHGADVMPRNDKGFSALKAAKYKRYTGIVAALEKAGARK